MKKNFNSMVKLFITKNKTDIICYSFILFFFLFLCFLYWGKLGNLIVDYGRETYVSIAISNGGVLYKNIFNIYSPLGYQLNAIIYQIFGEKFSVLYSVGAINTLVILTCIYYISRKYLSEFLSMGVCFLTMTLCCFSPGDCSNFIFPYSYSTYYALTFFLIAFICLFEYLSSENKDVFAISSFLFLGISLAFKIEFILFLPILLCSIAFLKPIKKVSIFISIILFFIAPALSFGVLFLQGLNYSDIVYHLHFMKKYAEVPSMKYFLDLNKIYPSYAFTYIKAYLQSISALLLLNFIFYFGFQYKNIDKWKRRQIFIIALLSLILFMQISLEFFIHFDYLYNIGLEPWKSPYFIGWLGISSLFILIIQLIYFVKNKGRNFEDKFFVILVLTSLLTNRDIFLTNTDSYANFTFPLTLIANLIFWVKYVPVYFQKLDVKNWRKAIGCVLICVTLFFELNYYWFIMNPKNKDSRPYLLKTERGSVYVKKDEGYCLQQAMDYVNDDMQKNATFIMLPEGAMLNFITGRPSRNADVFHTLIPPVVEAFGEDYIIKKLSLNPTDYIFINTSDNFEYGHKYFGIDYAQKIMQYINENYLQVKVIDQKFSKFSIRIYKRKNV